MNKIKSIALYIMAIFYILAGLNHFINPEGYMRLIPEYLPNHFLLNLMAGICEVSFGIGLLIPKARPLASWGIIIMLIAFIPTHVYFIQLNSCVENGLCLPPWTGWFRLVIIHPLLIYWAYLYTSKE
ncbi:DoxX family protein [Algoriphagus yeomjeoni]|uniref:DoxX family protein n=1 Tax=Algoriphagus yeomjeoni TaxID=291403 RepID=UPI003CE4AF4B